MRNLIKIRKDSYDYKKFVMLVFPEDNSFYYFSDLSLSSTAPIKVHANAFTLAQTDHEAGFVKTKSALNSKIFHKKATPSQSCFQEIQRYLFANIFNYS